LGAGFAKQFGGASKEVLVPHINNWFLAGKFPDAIPITINPNKPKDTAFHPSGDCLGCARVLFARRQGLLAYDKPDLPLLKSFFYGHYIHGLIYFVLQDLGFTTDYYIEDPIDARDGELWIKGHVDCSNCAIPGQDEPYMVDIKSQQGFAFNKPASESHLYEKYVAQVKLYMYFKQMTKTIILWAEKDQPHGYRETIIQHDPDFVEQILDKWILVVEAEKAGSIPPCTCEQGQSCEAYGLLT
jgi:hypothetical protein